MRTLDQILYPSLIGGALLTHGLCVALGASPMTAVYTVSSLSMLMAALLEWKRPFRNDWQKSHGDFTADFLSTYGVFSLVIQLVKFTLIFLALSLVAAHPVGGALAGVGPWLDARFAPGLQLFFWVPVAELLYYGFHLTCHRVPFFWRFHSVHHGAPRVYWANSGRFHPVDLAISLFFLFLPLYFLGASESALGWFLSFNAITGLLEHANIDYQAGAINRVFNSAELHRWHHSQSAEVSAKNLGKTLSIWDQIFGTYYRPAGRKVAEVGISGQAPVPVKLLGQFAYPFRSIKRS